MSAPDERALDPADPRLDAVPLPPPERERADLPLPDWDPLPPEE
ncbi:hypothetical protein [Actinomycetospora soli]|nr:hypothetical protein [Actinomycetospora soli]